MFHITENGPRPCGATIGKCPYGKVVDYYDNVADAQRFYEKKQFEKHGSISSMSLKKSVTARRIAARQQATGAEKVLEDLKHIKQASKRKPKSEFLKANGHILTPVSEREKAQINRMRLVLSSR